MNNVRAKAWWNARAEAGSKYSKLRALLQPGLSSLWPLGRDTNSKLWPYAIACVEVVLARPEFVFFGETISPAGCYAEIVESMQGEGWRLIVESIKTAQGSESLDWVDNAAQCWARQEARIPLGPGVAEAIEKYQHYEDVQDWARNINLFILGFFNRGSGVENGIFKVQPQNAPLLVTAIIQRSIIDYLQFDAAKLRRYRNADVDAIMTARPYPSTREGREIRSHLTNIYKREGFNRKADDTLLSGAEAWYKCRVNPGSIEAYLQELADLDLKGQEPRYRDQGRVSNDIMPYDEATGYPRK